MGLSDWFTGASNVRRVFILFLASSVLSSAVVKKNNQNALVVGSESQVSEVVQESFPAEVSFEQESLTVQHAVEHSSDLSEEFHVPFQFSPDFQQESDTSKTQLESRVQGHVEDQVKQDLGLRKSSNFQKSLVDQVRDHYNDQGMDLSVRDVAKFISDAVRIDTMDIDVIIRGTSCPLAHSTIDPETAFQNNIDLAERRGKIAKEHVKAGVIQGLETVFGDHDIPYEDVMATKTGGAVKTQTEGMNALLKSINLPDSVEQGVEDGKLDAIHELNQRYTDADDKTTFRDALSDARGADIIVDITFDLDVPVLTIEVPEKAITQESPAENHRLSEAIHEITHSDEIRGHQTHRKTPNKNIPRYEARKYSRKKSGESRQPDARGRF